MIGFAPDQNILKSISIHQNSKIFGKAKSYTLINSKHPIRHHVKYDGMIKFYFYLS